MTRLPPPEQWVLSKMNEMEVAEMIEQHIDFYTVDEDGNRRSVHLPTPFVRHFMKRSDGALPTSSRSRRRPSCWRMASCWRRTASTACAASSSSSRTSCARSSRSARTAPRSAVKAAMEFLCDEWLVDVATDYTGKATIIAAALTLIERSLLPDRPCFFVTAGRRGGGKTTTLIMLIMAVTGLWPAAAAWSTNEEERRKALMSYFLVRRALHPVGQHRARHADLVPAHREVLHLRVLFRPQARRQRNGLHRRLDHPPLHRQQYRGEGRSGLAQPAHPPRRRPRRPREPDVQAPRPDRLDREPPRRDPGGALHHPARQSRSSRRRATPRARPGSRCGGGWSARRSSTPPSWPGRSSTSRSCSSRRRRTTRKRPRSPTCSKSW